MIGCVFLSGCQIEDAHIINQTDELIAFVLVERESVDNIREVQRDFAEPKAEVDCDTSYVLFFSKYGLIDARQLGHGDKVYIREGEGRIFLEHEVKERYYSPFETTTFPSFFMTIFVISVLIFIFSTISYIALAVGSGNWKQYDNAKFIKHIKICLLIIAISAAGNTLLMQMDKKRTIANNTKMIQKAKRLDEINMKILEIDRKKTEREAVK